MQKIFFISLSILISSCVSYSPEIEEVFRQAGSNRRELAKVLKHYSHNPADSLKLRAAEFLIVNMPGKYSEYYDAPWNDVATVMLRWTSSSNKRLVVDTYQLGVPVKKDDVTHITADYLINNIELAFQVWHEMPWGKDISFEIFCEEILPYRVGNEPLENWRAKALASFADPYNFFIENPSTTTVEACTRINSLLPRFRIDKDFPAMSFSQLMASSRGDCDEMSALGVFAMRALGIPVSIDFTPFWPDRLYGHTWNAVYDNVSGNYTSFSGADYNPDEHQISHPTSKKMRRTFSIRNIIDAESDDIPPSLRYINGKDVTLEYGASVDVIIPLVNPPDTELKFAFLATPFETVWTAIAAGDVINDSIRFPSLGRRVLYLPIYFHNQLTTTAYYPFWIDEDGNSRFFKPGDMQEIKLTRLAPPDEPWVQRMVDGVFQGANNEDFSDAQTLYVIKIIDGVWFHTANIKNNNKFRYVRYVSPRNANCNVAEIEFYNDAGTKLSGVVTGTTETWGNSPMTRKMVFDGDPATYFDASNDNSWAGLDLGEPQKISKIRYLPRNDGYGVYEGHVYEAFYWDGRWQSLGRKTADSHYIKYEAPSNALLLVRNITANRIYRRPCIIENGIQTWLAHD